MITLVGRVDADTASGTTLTNSATASATTTDPTPGNNNDTHATTVTTSADVQPREVGHAVAAGRRCRRDLLARRHQQRAVRRPRPSWSPTPCRPRLTDPLGDRRRRHLHHRRPAGHLHRGLAGLRRPGRGPVRVTVASGQTAAVVNTGTVTTTTTDPTPGNNTAQTTTPVSRVADLEIIKSRRPEDRRGRHRPDLHADRRQQRPVRRRRHRRHRHPARRAHVRRLDDHGRAPARPPVSRSPARSATSRRARR